MQDDPDILEGASADAMSTDGTRRAPGPSAPGRSGRALSAALVAALLAGTLALATWQRDQRVRLEQRLVDSAAADADFTETALADLGRRQATAAEAVLADRIDDDAVGGVAAQLGVGFALVLGPDGEVLAAHPPRELDGAELLARFEHLRRAMGGQVGVSATLASDNFPSGVGIAVAAPFEAADGRRVLSTAFDRTQTILDRYLAAVRVTPRSAAWLVDDTGGIVAHGADAATPPPPEDVPAPGDVATTDLRGLAVAVATAPVEGTPWSVVVTSPTDEIFAPVAGLALWRPWLFLVALAVMVALQAALLVRNRRVGGELADANAELAATADRMREFVAVAAHELRTPAAVILGYARRLAVQGRHLEPDEVERYGDRLAGASRRLGDLLDQLLVQATADRGRLPQSPTDVPLATVVADAVAAAGLAGEGVEVRVPEGTWVRADPTHLERVLANLLENAADHGAPPIRVTAATAGEVVEVAVRDHGRGVPSSFAPHLFERFATAGGDDRRVGRGGAGLGLSVAASVAAEMGGSLRHEPADPGARFVLRLPSAPPVTTAAEPPGQRPAQRVTSTDRS